MGHNQKIMVSDEEGPCQLIGQFTQHVLLMLIVNIRIMDSTLLQRMLCNGNLFHSSQRILYLKSTLNIY